MKETRIKIINACLVLLGLMGYVALCLPWYELTASSSISGFGTSSMSGGKWLGFAAAGTSVFGYALYILPAIIIGMVKVQAPARAKCLGAAVLGTLEWLCLFLVNNNMGNHSSSISGYGYESSAGFDVLPGWTVAMVIYCATVVVAAILIAVAPKEEPKKPETNAAENNINAPM